MSQVKRYDARLVVDACGNKDVVMREAHDGLFVHHSDYAALEQRNEALVEALKAIEDKADGYADDSEDGLRGLRFREVAKQARAALQEEG